MSEPGAKGPGDIGSGANEPPESSPLPGSLVLTIDVSAVPRRPAGAGRYIVELTRALHATGEVDVFLVTKRHDTARWEEIAPGAEALAAVPRMRPLRLGYERFVLGRRLERGRSPRGRGRARDRVDGQGPAHGMPPSDVAPVYHGPHYTLPDGLSCGRVVTVHDLTFFDHPEWHERSKVAFFRRAIERSARLADVVVCVSDTTARRLGELVEVRGEVVVATHGVDHARFRPGDPLPEALPPALRAGHAELVVHVGTLEPRKGVVDLLAAFDELASARPSAHLALAGLPGWGAAEVEQALRRLRHADRVHRLGFVSDETVVSLMRAARVVAYPSREEGFGLPALEAMATGTPLVTTTGTTMAEFAGGAAWLAPPGDRRQLAAALAAALDAPAEERFRRISAGIERAATFTWDRTARRHLEAYRLAGSAAAARR